MSRLLAIYLILTHISLMWETDANVWKITGAELYDKTT